MPMIFASLMVLSADVESMRWPPYLVCQVRFAETQAYLEWVRIEEIWAREWRVTDVRRDAEYRAACWSAVFDMQDPRSSVEYRHLEAIRLRGLLGEEAWNAAALPPSTPWVSPPDPAPEKTKPMPFAKDQCPKP